MVLFNLCTVFFFFRYQYLNVMLFAEQQNTRILVFIEALVEKLIESPLFITETSNIVCVYPKVLF